MPVISRVTCEPSPTLDAFYGHHPLLLTCDSGATSSLIKKSVVDRLDMPMSPTSHLANQADGKTKMEAVGEVHVNLSRGGLSFHLAAVVVTNLDCEILAGVPFHKYNGILLDMPNDTIILPDKTSIHYGSKAQDRPSLKVRRSSAFLLRSDTKKTLLPGEFITIPSPAGLQDNVCIAIEPRGDEKSTWIQPLITKSIEGQIRIANHSISPVAIDKHQHLAQIHYTATENELKGDIQPIITICLAKSKPHHPAQFHSDSVIIDPDQVLSLADRKDFAHLHRRYDNVFNSRIGAYNDASGHIRAFINMGPTEPPPQKARLPSYNTEKMRLLQQKMDELEDLGILARPEDVNVAIEHISPSFLVRKPDGSHRLVTAFNNIGAYAKHIPSKPTSTEEVLRFLAGFRYIIKTDMTKQFFQMQMKKSSLKYLGVLTPFKGMRVYTRAAMGMPGSTEHLDELMSRVLGDLMLEGVVKKIADDLYTGGDTIQELLHNWEKILQRFEANNLRLSASKTAICPVTTTILGWIWSAGTIAASPHKVTPLATSPLPKTVKSLRSWIGAFKHLKVCVPQYSSLLSALEAATAGLDSRSIISWTQTLEASFYSAQQSLGSLQGITIPRSSDKLTITTDGAVKNGGIGAVLYVGRDKDMHVGGFFSAKLKPHQRKWLPCEVEALAISSTVEHWGPYIIENHHSVQVLTDSRPCVQAYAKLCRGQFSSSARISTFLSTLSRYHVTLQHIPGHLNLPADFHSRHPPECHENSCQICTFIQNCESSSVNRISVSDILEGRSLLPYISPVAWKASQQDCPSLRRTYSHLVQGTRPTKKVTNVRDVKRYLQVCTVGRDGLLVCRRQNPFAAARDLIVLPRHVISGLLSALH